MSHYARRVCAAVTCACWRARGLAFLCTALLLALGAPRSRGAHAAPSAGIVVNDLGDNTTAGNGQCTLREAINNANIVGTDGASQCSVAVRFGKQIDAPSLGKSAA
jgi:CSLREA domain-containing protein